jgi:2-polyprenyl-3-methyl-5-hydroxy-6-metoxy-1,4-benzoquinol methylase
MVLRAERAPGKTAARYELKPGRYSSYTLVLAALPQQERGRTILDLGCSGGDLGVRLVERGFAPTCVDRPGETPPALPEAAALLAADLEEGLPGLLRPPFDFILCADVLEHLLEPDRLLASLPGALAEGGRLVASLPNGGNLYFRLNILMGRFPAHDRGLFERTHLHFYTWRGSGGIAAHDAAPCPYTDLVRFLKCGNSK